MASSVSSATSPGLQILPCNAEDIPECMAVLSDSFGHDSAFIDMWYPEHWTPSGLSAATTRLRAWFDGGASWFLKAVDTSSSPPRIIGLAIWTHMAADGGADKKLTLTSDDLKTAQPDPEKIWPEANGEIAFVQQIWRSLVQDRREYVVRAGTKGAMVLEMLGVRRDGQRKGAGQALVKWGTQKADDLAIPSFVEATPPGAKTYARCGFQVLREITWDVDEELSKTRRLPELESMYRPLATGL